MLGDPPKPTVSIERLSEPSHAAHEILEEYYEAVHVVKRDKPSDLRALFAQPTSAMWLAKLLENENSALRGPIRNMPSVPAPQSANDSRSASGPRRHVATLLLDALEEHARNLKNQWIYLDTYNDLKPAIALYEQRGYERCDRYNDNPQATLFMRKRLSSLPPSP